MNDEFKPLQSFDAGKGHEGFLYSLPALEASGARVIASIWGRTVADYEGAARALLAWRAWKGRPFVHL